MKKTKKNYARKWKAFAKTAALAVQEAEASISPEKESPSEQIRKKISRDLINVMDQQRAAVVAKPRISRSK